MNNTTRNNTEQLQQQQHKTTTQEHNNKTQQQKHNNNNNATITTAQQHKDDNSTKQYNNNNNQPINQKDISSFHQQIANNTNTINSIGVGGRRNEHSHPPREFPCKNPASSLKNRTTSPLRRTALCPDPISEC